MQNVIYGRLKKFFLENPEMQGVPVSLVEIGDIEEKIDTKLPKEFKDFIMKFGGSFAGIAIYGLKNAEMLGNESVVELTLHAREMLKKLNINNEILESTVISDDGAGNPIFINSNGIVKVYYVDNNEIIFLGNSLNEIIENNFKEW